EDLALVEVEGDVGERLDAAEAHRDLVHLQQRRHQTFTTVGVSTGALRSGSTRVLASAGPGKRGPGGKRFRNRSCQSGTTPCGVRMTCAISTTPTISGNQSV